MFTPLGSAALARVCTITGEARNFDPFGGNSYGVWMPTGQRINFHARIRQYVLLNAAREMGPTLDGQLWVLCSYCNWHYPENRIQVDHMQDWATYSMRMTTAGNMNQARAWEVYIGCNDPNNLLACCDSCNSSKGNRPATPLWIQGRQNLANLQGGF